MNEREKSVYSTKNISSAFDLSFIFRCVMVMVLLCCVQQLLITRNEQTDIHCLPKQISSMSNISISGKLYAIPTNQKRTRESQMVKFYSIFSFSASFSSDLFDSIQFGSISVLFWLGLVLVLFSSIFVRLECSAPHTSRWNRM